MYFLHVKFVLHVQPSQVLGSRLSFPLHKVKSSQITYLGSAIKKLSFSVPRLFSCLYVKSSGQACQVFYCVELIKVRSQKTFLFRSKIKKISFSVPQLMFLLRDWFILSIDQIIKVHNWIIKVTLFGFAFQNGLLCASIHPCFFFNH